jgi:hypothetical protein
MYIRPINWKSHLSSIDLYRNLPPDDFHTKVAKTPLEITELLEAGFEHVLQKDGRSIDPKQESLQVSRHQEIRNPDRSIPSSFNNARIIPRFSSLSSMCVKSWKKRKKRIVRETSPRCVYKTLGFKDEEN